MIEHLRGREKALEPLGWTGREAEWIALVCLHSGVFTRAQFCRYFNTQRMTALRFVKALIEQRAAVETDVIPFNGGGRACRISGKALYRALGVENIRHRRKAGTPVVMRRLLSLDFVLEHPGLNWLPTEGEKVEFIEGLGVHSNLIPRRIYYGAVRAQAARCRGRSNRHLRLCRSGPCDRRGIALMGSGAWTALGCDSRQGAAGGGNRHWRGTGYGFAGGSSATALGGGGAGKGGNRVDGEAGDQRD